jgi:hypothetical protein
MGIFSGHMVGRQAKCPYIMGPILPAGLKKEEEVQNLVQTILHAELGARLGFVDGSTFNLEDTHRRN